MLVLKSDRQLTCSEILYDRDSKTVKAAPVFFIITERQFFRYYTNLDDILNSCVLLR